MASESTSSNLEADEPCPVTSARQIQKTIIPIVVASNTCKDNTFSKYSHNEEQICFFASLCRHLCFSDGYRTEAEFLKKCTSECLSADRRKGQHSESLSMENMAILTPFSGSDKG